MNWQRQDSLSSLERLEVLALLNRLEVEFDRESLDEGRRRVVVHGWKGQHWLHYEDGVLSSYALATGNDPVVVELAGGGVDVDLLDELLQLSANVDWWTRDVQPAFSKGRIIRTLHLLEVDIPIPVEALPHEVTMRTFEVGRDEQAWLIQNNRSFSHHPEQGAWTLEDISMRTMEPWFDPSGFLLFEIDDVIVASCWTKVHELHPDRFGEIYVVSVDPAYQGRKLGKVAVTQGLNVLRKKGVSRGSLFVDSSNEHALALYKELGFAPVRQDNLWRFERSV